MLRQLARLTRRYPAAGPGALAVAVYADADDHPVAAAESGAEGVACVDDAARAVVLFSDLWTRTGAAGALAAARGFLDFCLWMADDDGLVVNFVSDWEGTKNCDGPTSRRGGIFWHARALRAFARGATMLRDERAGIALERALAAVPHGGVPADVRALHVLTALELGVQDRRNAGILARWCEEIAAVRDGDVLLNSPDERGIPHLWGHVQEGALALAARRLERPGLLEVAVRSAEALVVPAIESAFALPVVQPYAVASAAFVMDQLHAATGRDRYARLAAAARAWFEGRNEAGAPVYDRVRGRVADGIDHGTVSRNSGAEANIVGAQALLDEVVRAVRSGHYDAALARYSA